jgi:ribosome-associated heat shock protein Hsp15
MSDDRPADGVLRIDKWLWYARMAKTRSLAARLCAQGLVSVGATPAVKANHPVRVGDRVSVPQGRALRRLVVLSLGERRGPPAQARHLYDEPEPPQPMRAAEPAWIPLFDDDPRA